MSACMYADAYTHVHMLVIRAYMKHACVAGLVALALQRLENCISLDARRDDGDGQRPQPLVAEIDRLDLFRAIELQHIEVWCTHIHVLHHVQLNQRGGLPDDSGLGAGGSQAGSNVDVVALEAFTERALAAGRSAERRSKEA